MLSVIITAFDKHLITKIHVRECMNSLIVPDEIIVVNDGGTPDLKDMLQQLEKKTKIIYAEVLPPKIPWNYNGAVNLGVYLSRGDFLAIEDNDNIPQKDFYGQAINILENNFEIGLVFGKIRQDVSVKDLEKTIEEWDILGSRGPNRGTYIIKREIYLKLKGQDERFCGKYGWMWYDFRQRLLNRAKTKFSEIGTFYYIVEGQSNLSRKVSSENYHLYHKNAKNMVIQSPVGILNFTFKFEVL